jgi:hypothetical protein
MRIAPLQLNVLGFEPNSQSEEQGILTDQEFEAKRKQILEI